MDVSPLRAIAAAVAIIYIVYAFRAAIPTNNNHTKMAAVIFVIFQISKIYVSIAVGIPGCSGVTLIDAYSMMEYSVIWFLGCSELLYSATHFPYDIQHFWLKTIAIISSEVFFMIVCRVEVVT